MVLMLVCHWVACFWSMALNLGDGFEKSWYDTLEVSEGPRDSMSTYVAAFYFACYTITSVGFGDVVPKNVVERSMCSAILIVSGLAWAYILGEVGAIVSDMTSESQEFRRAPERACLARLLDDVGLVSFCFFMFLDGFWGSETRP